MSDEEYEKCLKHGLTSIWMNHPRAGASSKETSATCRTRRESEGGKVYLRALDNELCLPCQHGISLRLFVRKILTGYPSLPDASLVRSFTLEVGSSCSSNSSPSLSSRLLFPSFLYLPLAPPIRFSGFKKPST